ncbi:MAG: hypothetical protein R3B13_21120 [Polyangiaceae bacterium]
MNSKLVWACAIAVTTVSLGCEEKKAENLAPTSSALAPAEKPTQSAITFAIENKGSKVTFLMDAPIEKIHGEATDASEGQFHVDLMDTSKTTGLIKVDLDKLALFQQKREDEQGEFSEKTKSDKQNEHARAWLEISEDAPKETREKNRWAEFKINKLDEVSVKDLTKATGAERKLTAVAVGEFRLHERKTDKKAKIEAIFKFEGDKPVSVSVKTVEPMAVGLEEHDVRPREAFGKLAQKTLGALGNKVAAQAPIQLELSAKVGGDGAKPATEEKGGY